VQTSHGTTIGNPPPPKKDSEEQQKWTQIA